MIFYFTGEITNGIGKCGVLGIVPTTGTPTAKKMLKVQAGDKVWLITSGTNLRINMEAYGGTAEASMPPYDWALLSDITNDGTVDFVDFAHIVPFPLNKFHFSNVSFRT